MIKRIDIVKIILVIFFFSRFIRSLATRLTGNYTLGSAVPDLLIVGIFLFYVIDMLANGKLVGRLRWPTMLLLVLLVAGIYQGFMLLSGNVLEFDGKLVWAFYAFRKIYFPLIILPVFLYLLKNEVEKEGGKIFEKFVDVFKFILVTAVTYQIGEFVLRNLSGTLNTLYYDNLIAPTVNTSIENAVVDMYKELFGTGIRYLRIYGIGLDYYTSGGIILVSYLYLLFFSARSKLLSVSNIFVLIAVILTGGQQIIIPFFLVNLLLLFKNKKIDLLIKYAFVAIFAAIAISSLTNHFLNATGYIVFFNYLFPTLIEYSHLFIFGVGPPRLNLFGGAFMIADLPVERFKTITDFGLIQTIMETGIILFSIFLLFYCFFLFLPAKNISDEAAREKLFRIKFILGFELFIFMLHASLLFDRTVYIYTIFFMALTYLYWKKSSRALSPQVMA
jgi:hypothetical protein